MNTKVVGLNSLDVIRDLEYMAWTQLQYRRAEVDRAGTNLLKLLPLTEITEREEAEGVHAIEVIGNFRAAHAFPLNTLQNNLRVHAKIVDEDSIVAQRLKRFSSIFAKLQRFKTMKLWDMQDIAGCRAILHSVDNVQKLVSIYKDPSSRMRHKLAHEDDYIKRPRDSGYRSYHLVYRYFSDSNEIYNGLKVEMQIRTVVQHAWATTVETVDAFTQQALKSSSGRPDWERFFQLMGTEMAFRENAACVPGTPTDRKEVTFELRRCATALQVKKRLSGFTRALKYAMQSSGMKDSQYFLLSLDAVAESLSITGYNRSEFTKASEDYANLEQKIRETTGRDAVLVSVDSIHTLQRAYPNYFADTSMFLDILDESVKGK